MSVILTVKRWLPQLHAPLPKRGEQGPARECVRLSPFSREEKSFLNHFPSEFLFRSHWPYWAHRHPLVQGGPGKLGAGEGAWELHDWLSHASLSGLDIWLP